MNELRERSASVCIYASLVCMRELHSRVGRVRHARSYTGSSAYIPGLVLKYNPLKCHFAPSPRLGLPKTQSGLFSFSLLSFSEPGVKLE